MSTSINVVIDGVDGSKVSLLERAKRQVEANRLEKLETDKAQKAAELAVIQQELVRRKQDGGSGDQIVKAQPYRKSVQEEEPGVRRPLGYWFLRPHTPPGANAWFGAGQAAVIPLRRRGSYPASLTSGTSSAIGLGRPTYLPTGGPNERPALSSQPAVGIGQDANFPELSGTGMRANTFVRQFTLQMMFRLGSTFNLQMPWPEVEVNFADLAMGFSLQNTGTGAGEIFKNFYYSLNSGLYDRPSVPDPYGASNVPFSSPAAPDLSPGVWHHAAMTFKDGVAYAFFNGLLIGQSQVGQPLIRLSTSSGYTSIGIRFGQTVALIDPADPVLIHGVKFEEFCRWTASYTPPQNL